MDWTNEQTLEFIELYEKYPIIWNAAHPGHKNRNLLSDAWTKIASEFSMEVEVATLKKKKESLMSTYRTVKKKVTDSEITGTGTDEVYQPHWFAYEALDRFVHAVGNKRPSLNSEDVRGASTQQVDVHTSNENDRRADNSEQEEDPAPHDEVENAENEENLRDRNTFSVPPTPSAQRKRAKYQNAVDSQAVSKHLEKASEVLQTLANKPTSSQGKQQLSDGPSLYGQLLANKLRKLSPRARLLLQNKIDNLVFAAELEELDAPVQRNRNSFSFINHSPGSYTSLQSPNTMHGSHSTPSPASHTSSHCPSPISPLFFQSMSPHPQRNAETVQNVANSSLLQYFSSADTLLATDLHNHEEAT